MKNYDVIVIGGGSAGFAVLEQIAHKFKRIALIENRKLGGSCPNFACVPSKALIKSAEVLHTAKNASRFGINIKDISFDWKKVQEYRADKVANTAAAESEQDLKEKGVDLIWGTARFVSPYEIEVDPSTLQRVQGRTEQSRSATSSGQVGKFVADKFAITTGSRATMPSIPGMKEVEILDSDQALQLNKLPKSLATVGAGPVGIEASQMFARFGVKVVVIVRGDQILSREEPEIANFVQEYLENDSVEFILNADVLKFSKNGKLKRIEVKAKDQIGTIEAEEILMAAGRTPNIDMLGLEKIGVEASDKGVKTNEHMQTTKPHIYCAGDCAGIMLFTHAASYEGFIIGQNLLNNKIKADHRVIPRGTFTDPEVGSVGIMEKEAKDKGFKVQTALMDYTGGRGDIQSDPLGLIKVTVDGKTRQILGASVVGRGAAEFIHMIAMAMHHKIKVDDLDTMIYAFPTYAEGLAGITSYLK